MPAFFLIFIVIPLLEIFIFAEVGEAVGGWNVVFMVLATGIIGTWCVRAQGLSTLMSAQQKLNSGQIPAQELVSGIAIVIAGILLIVPGFLTDFIGVLLFIPPVRGILWSFFKVQSFSTQFSTAQEKRGYDDETIIDADFEVIDDEDDSVKQKIPHKN